MFDNQTSEMMNTIDRMTDKYVAQMDSTAYAASANPLERCGLTREEVVRKLKPRPMRIEKLPPRRPQHRSEGENPDKARVREWLQSHPYGFHRAGDIANELNMSSQSVGNFLHKIAVESPELTRMEFGRRTEWAWQTKTKEPHE